MDVEPRIITLSKNANPERGNLTYIEKDLHIPFAIKRTSLIYRVSGDTAMKGYAYKNQENFIIPLSGSLDVVLDNGTEKEIFRLNAANKGLYVPAGNWIQMSNFSTNAMVMILGSAVNDKGDVIREYEEFQKMKNQ